MNTLDLTCNTLTGTLLHKAIKVVALYKQMMHSSQLLKTESLRKDKAQKQETTMSELDRAVEILEGFGLDKGRRSKSKQ